MKIKVFTVTVCCLLAAGFAMAAQDQASNIAAAPWVTDFPAWLEQGKFRFARFDGGPIEIQKTQRSAWGMRFTPAEQQVLANVYGKYEYGPRMADLLAQAHVNFVWVTYSVGFSWDDESPQRALVREITGMLHAHGIKVAAYMDADAMFWQSMFRDLPQSVHWLSFDPNGLPYRYSGGHDALRFIADMNNPEWVAFEEKRIGAIIDDGLDAIFFDNTGDADWNNNQSVAGFFTKIQEFIHDKKHSDIPLFSNFDLSPSRAELNRYVNFTFDEHWREPGSWGDEWDVSNIRRTRYLRGLLPPGRPVITEYSIFHEGTRASGFLKPRSEKLSIAEAATFGAAYGWDMEGPFDERLMARDSAALASWAAISQYNGFLADHGPLYVGARNVTPIAVLLPDDFHPGFAWDDPSPLIDFLSENSVLYDLKLASQLNASELAAYRGIIVPSYASMSAAEKQMISGYAASGGAVYIFADQSDVKGPHTEVSAPGIEQRLTEEAARREIRAKLALLQADATHVELKTQARALANITVLDHGQKLLVHLLNYSSPPVENIHVRLILGQRFSRFRGGTVSLVSPDVNVQSVEAAHWNGSALDFTLPSLDVYSVVELKANEAGAQGSGN